MLGIDDVAFIFVATTLANLVVEFGAEIVAEWIVQGEQAEGASPAALDHFAGMLDSTCIPTGDSVFSTLVANAPLADSCVAVLRLVVN